MGSDLSYDDVSGDCFPLIQNGSLLLNPCGLIANSLFNGSSNLLTCLTITIYVFVNDIILMKNVVIVIAIQNVRIYL